MSEHSMTYAENILNAWMFQASPQCADIRPQGRGGNTKALD